MRFFYLNSWPMRAVEANDSSQLIQTDSLSWCAAASVYDVIQSSLRQVALDYSPHHYLH